jgi:hypothetical protein
MGTKTFKIEGLTYNITLFSAHNLETETVALKVKEVIEIEPQVLRTMLLPVVLDRLLTSARYVMARFYSFMYA